MRASDSATAQAEPAVFEALVLTVRDALARLQSMARAAHVGARGLLAAADAHGLITR